VRSRRVTLIKLPEGAFQKAISLFVNAVCQGSCQFSPNPLSIATEGYACPQTAVKPKMNSFGGLDSNLVQTFRATKLSTSCCAINGHDNECEQGGDILGDCQHRKNVTYFKFTLNPNVAVFGNESLSAIIPELFTTALSRFPSQLGGDSKRDHGEIHTCCTLNHCLSK